jgi:hypothetical protein
VTDRSDLSAHADLADALAGLARAQAAADPRARGADWRLATVTAVATDGTVTCDDVITARRLPTYLLPTVGDVIVLTVSGSGNWLAAGRLETSSGQWTDLPLNSGFEWPGHGAHPQYLIEGRRCWLRGRIGAASGTIANGTPVCNLPAQIRPANGEIYGWVGPRNSNVYPAVCRMEILAGGDIRTYEVDNPPTWVSLDGVTYDI